MRRTIGYYLSLKSLWSVIKKKFFSIQQAGNFLINGIDISKWNGTMDFNIVQNLVRFIYLRGGNGAYLDPLFKVYKTEVVNRKIPWGLYWFVYVGQNIDVQVNAFVNVIKEGGWILPPVADFEITTLSVEGTTNYIKTFMERVQTQVNGKMVIYTGPGWWNANVQRNTWAAKYHLWVAHWTSADQPILPKDWTSALFWQWSANGNNKGREYGSIDGDYDMDLDRYMGDAASWAELIGSTPEEPPVEPPQTKYKVSISDLSIRTGPFTSYAAIARREAGDVVEAEDYNLWIKDEKGWSAVRHDGKDYMEEM
jgi:GH25 family lysozyme M1 (1,4-beta-N-acetylmuramidase)